MVFYYQATNIMIYYPKTSYSQSRVFRMMVMKVQ